MNSKLLKDFSRTTLTYAVCGMNNATIADHGVVRTFNCPISVQLIACIRVIFNTGLKEARNEAERITTAFTDYTSGNNSGFIKIRTELGPKEGDIIGRLYDNLENRDKEMWRIIKVRSDNKVDIESLVGDQQTCSLMCGFLLLGEEGDEISTAFKTMSRAINHSGIANYSVRMLWKEE